MARYCFYCSRELEAGEKCNCRSENKAANERYKYTTSTTDSKFQQENGSTYQQQNDPSDKNAKKKANAEKRAKKKAEKESYKQFKNAEKQRKKASKQQSPYVNASIFIRQGRQLLQYLTLPVDTIKQATHLDQKIKTLIFLVLNAFAGAFLMLLLHKRFLALFIPPQLLNSLNAAGNFSQSLLLFWKGFALFAVFPLINIGVIYLLIRYLSRIKIQIKQIFAAFHPAAFYLLFFTLLALLNRSPFYGLTMLLAGFIVMLISLLLAVKELSYLNPNRIFMYLFILLFVNALLFSTLAQSSFSLGAIANNSVNNSF